MTRREQLLAFAEKLGHTFEDLSLLDQALTHSSDAYEAGGGHPHNEPLEFLGDAVVGLLVAELLHRRSPLGDEGGKSFARAALVSSASLARRAAEVGLPELLLLGRGEEKTGGRKKTALWTDAFEAVVAALYLDGGLPAARRLVERVLAADLAKGSGLAVRDHKSELQELLQGQGRPLPEYRVVAEQGPSHEPRFRVECLIEGQAVSEGEGASKKIAQLQAALRALGSLRAGS
jgi:ribonuclease-3